MRTDEAWSLYRLALIMLKVQSRDLAIDYLTEVGSHSLESFQSLARRPALNLPNSKCVPSDPPSLCLR